jgi:hypothetical protein
MTEQQKEALKRAQQAVAVALATGINSDHLLDRIIQTVIEAEGTKPRGAEGSPQSSRQINQPLI